MLLNYRGKTLSYLILTSWIISSEAYSGTANFRYHCEQYRTRNGKPNTNDRVLQLTFDKPFPVNSFIVVENELGQKAGGLHFSRSEVLEESSDGVVTKYRLNLEYDRLTKLKKSLDDFLVTKFRAKQLRYKLNWQLDPISGELDRSVEAYWGEEDKSGILDLQPLPAHRKIVKKEQLPFENIGYHAGEFFLQTESDSGFFVNLSTLLRGDFLSNKLVCRKRQLEKSVEELALAKPIVDSSAEKIFFSAILDLVLEVLMHKSPHEVTVPVLKKYLKKFTSLSSRNDNEAVLSRRYFYEWLNSRRHPYLISLPIDDQLMVLNKLAEITGVRL
jgi:hypothetical protein